MARRKKIVTNPASSTLGIASVFIVSEVVSMRKLQDDYINWILPKFGNDLDEAARALGITSRTIYNRIKHGNVQVIQDT